MTYTPQAGDVIAYRGDLGCNVQVIGDTDDTSTMHVSVHTNGGSSVTVESKDVLREMVAERGWTLVSRKEAADANRD